MVEIALVGEGRHGDAGPGGSWDRRGLAGSAAHSADPAAPQRPGRSGLFQEALHRKDIPNTKG